MSGMPFISGCGGPAAFLVRLRAYTDIRTKYAILGSLLQQANSVSDLFTDSEPNACAGFPRYRDTFDESLSVLGTLSESAFHVGSPLYPSDIFYNLD